MTTGSFTEHDLTLAEGLIGHLGQGDLLLADRAFCSYAFIAAILGRGGQVAMRLHQQRDAALDWRRGRKISPYERLVTWRRPACSTFRGKLTREAWEALPTTLEVRLIRLDDQDRTGRCRPLTMVTTLTDPTLHDGIELHCLYARRWEIELRLRDIKTTLGFEMLAVKTPEMALKTLAMIRIAYNLMRLLMQRAAREAGEPVSRHQFDGRLGVRRGGEAGDPGEAVEDGRGEIAVFLQPAADEVQRAVLRAGFGGGDTALTRASRLPETHLHIVGKVVLLTEVDPPPAQHTRRGQGGG